MAENLNLQQAVSLLTDPETQDTPVEEASTAADDMSSTEAETEAVVETEVAAVEEVDADLDGDDDDDADQVEPELIDVVINGERQQVTREEAANGYQRLQDYSRKTQELAKQRKSLAAETQRISAEREKYAQALEVMAGQLSADQEPDWSQLRDEDPFEYLQQKDIWRDKQERLQRVQSEQAKLYQERHAQMQQQAEQELLQQQSILLERIPAWKDQEVAQKEKSAISTYAKTIGFNDEEISSVVDARAVELLRKAYLYDQMMDGEKLEKKRVKKAPATAKSGQPKTKQERSSRQRNDALDKLKKSGRMNDAVAYLLQKG
jgi:hypothetical protein